MIRKKTKIKNKKSKNTMPSTCKTLFFISSPVTGLAASFGSVTACRQSKNGEASFLIEAKAAAFRLRSPAG